MYGSSSAEQELMGLSLPYSAAKDLSTLMKLEGADCWDRSENHMCHFEQAHLKRFDLFKLSGSQ